ncbi:YczE/YyaS/YitT family protein [Clostridium tertium]
MNLTNKKRILVFISGMVILTLGAALTIKADLGAGSWDSVNVGLRDKFGLSIGTFAFIIGVFMTIIAGILRKGKFNFYTLITAFGLGYLTDFWMFILNIIPISENIYIRYLYFVLGIIVLSTGLGIYLIPNLAPNSLDDCMMAFMERFNLSVGVSKIISDMIGIIIALSLSGPIGFGTIILTLVIGPLTNLSYNKFSKILLDNKIVVN